MGTDTETIALPTRQLGRYGPPITEQVDGWINSPLRKLIQGDLDEIAEALKKTGAGNGPITEEV